MRLAILSNSPKAYSTRRLKAAARARGHSAKVFSTSDFSMYLEQDQLSLKVEGKDLSRYQAFIPRIGPSATIFGIALVRHLEEMGHYCLTGSAGLSVARDKFRTLQLLAKNGVGVPPSAFVYRREDVLPAIERLGGTPVVVKLLQGTQGLGVMLVESLASAQTIIETLQTAQQFVLIQKFVAESKGRDIRAFVVGDQVVAAMRRVAKGDEFRSNIHLGGQGEPVKLPPEYVAAAINATQLVGLSVAGVDLLESHSGPQVMEVNASPGLEGIELASKVDVAGAIIEFLEKEAPR